MKLATLEPLPPTGLAREVAFEIGRRVGAFEAAHGPEAKPFADEARRRFFPQLDKAGWAPLGAGEDETHPVLVAVVGLVMVVLVPLVWGVIRRTEGLPYFGSPTVREIEEGYPPHPADRAE